MHDIALTTAMVSLLDMPVAKHIMRCLGMLLSFWVLYYMLGPAPPLQCNSYASWPVPLILDDSYTRTPVYALLV